MPRISLHVSGTIEGANVTEIWQIDTKGGLPTKIDVSEWTSEQVVDALEKGALVGLSHVMEDNQNEEISLDEFEAVEEKTCPTCGEPMTYYMDEGVGNTLVEVFGCQKCD